VVPRRDRRRVRRRPFVSRAAHQGDPYWRSRLDPACGIDVYGENGIAVADIDGDGLDEIYVCQPGGLPNRLYQNDGKGHFRDISKEFGLDILDDTTCALFVDLRNSGHQDLVLVRPTQPMLFLNDGKGGSHRFRRRSAFAPRRRALSPACRPPITIATAASICTSAPTSTFQSEAQYRYPTPYHDAQNGPPNFLMRNCLDGDPPCFEDVTAATGMDHNNNRFSFAGAWCDYNFDGWPDLYVANDFGRKNLYRNTTGISATWRKRPAWKTSARA
jgi:hypothetical protein